MNEICRRIDEAITDSDIQIQDIAAFCNVSRQQVARWRRSNAPTAENLGKICQICNVSADYILGLGKGLAWPR